MRRGRTIHWFLRLGYRRPFEYGSLLAAMKITSVLLSLLWVSTLAWSADAPPAPKPQPKPPTPQPAPKPAPAKPEAASEKPEAKPKAAEDKKPVAGAEESKDKKKTIEELTKETKKLGGLFELFIDEKKGKALMLVRKPQLGPEYIYFTHSVDGVVSAGYNRGMYGQEVVFTIRKKWDRIEFVAENTAFYFDPENPLAKAAEANRSDAILASQSVLAEDERGWLIEADPLFLKETLLMLKWPGSNPDKSVLGKLSDVKTKFETIHNYNDNTVAIVEYVFENPSPKWVTDHGVNADDIADPRYVTIKVQHSLIQMPENDYKPRQDDPRVGYFMTQVTDLTSPEVTPYRDVIHRWHLKKQKPGTKLSEPVEPITFWIENTTPVEFRDVIRTAALQWNKSFEKAGFKDALVIKQQPDNAKWSADNIHYNVLRWTSSPRPPFGGYGPSFVNPRTGQILGADIMLEYAFVTRRVFSDRLFSQTGLFSAIQDEPEQAEGFFGRPHLCAAGNCLQHGLLFGRTALRLRAADRLEVDGLVKEGLYYLILHELGHTLGLNHNFRSSYLHDPVKVHDRALTEKVGLTGSVMDYPMVNVAPKGVEQGQYYTTQPGPYDDWAIEYGYSEALEDPVAEQERLAKIASRSHRPELAFANDADDMRRVGQGMDPRAMIDDMSSDPVAYGIQRCELVRDELALLEKKFALPGESWQELSQAYVTLAGEAADALTVISRHVGGVHVERAFVGQTKDGPAPLTPVDRDSQIRAMAAMAEHGFSPGAFDAPGGLLAKLQQQRRGFDFFKEDQMPPFHDRILKVQRSLLDQLLSSSVQKRMLDSDLFGQPLHLGEMMPMLTAAVYKGDPETGPSTARQNLQTEYLNRLLGIVNGGSHLPAAKAIAYAEVESIRAELDSPPFVASPAHRKYLAYLIRRGLDEK